MKKIIYLFVAVIMLFTACDTIFGALNNEPLADAGTDQSIDLGETVYLDGSGSSDAEEEPLTFAWSFITKPTASELTNADITYIATETTASFTPDTAGDFVIQLEVNDGFFADTGTGLDTVTITVLGEVTVTAQGGIMEIELAWNADINAESYKLFWGTSADDLTTTGTSVDVNSGNSYIFSAPEAFVEYFFTLVSVYADDSESDPFNTVSVEATMLPSSLSFSSADGPSGGKFTFIEADDNDLYAASKTGTVFKSTDNGGSWSQFGESFSNEVLDIALSDNYVFVVTEGQYIYRSIKTTGSWSSFDGAGTGHIPSGGPWSKNRLYIGDGNIYAALNRETNVIFSSIETPSWSDLTTNDIYGSSFGSDLNDFRGVYLITGNDPSDTYDDDYIFIGTDAIWETADSREDTFAIMAAKADGTSSDWILLGDTGLAGPPSILQFTNSSQFESLYAGTYSGSQILRLNDTASGVTFDPLDVWNSANGTWADISDAVNMSGTPMGSFASGYFCTVITSTGNIGRISYSQTSWTSGTSSPVVDAKDITPLGSYYYFTSDSGIYTLDWGNSTSMQGQPLASKINDLVEWNDLVAVASETGLHFYDPAIDEFTQVQAVIEGEIRALAVDGVSLYIGDSDGNIYIYETDNTYATYTDPDVSYIGGLGFYNDLLYIFTHEEGIHTFSGGTFSEVNSTGHFLGKPYLWDGDFYMADKEGAGEDPHKFDPDTDTLTSFSLAGANAFVEIDGTLFAAVEAEDGTGGIYKATLPSTIFSPISSSWSFDDSTEGFYSLETDGRYLYSVLSSGAVYRSNLDGTDVTVYEEGLNDTVFAWTSVYYENAMYNPLLITLGRMYVGSVTEGLYFGE